MLKTTKQRWTKSDNASNKQTQISPSADPSAPLSPPCWFKMTANHATQNGEDKRTTEIKVGPFPFSNYQHILGAAKVDL